MTRFSILLLALVITCFVAELVVPQYAHAAGGVDDLTGGGGTQEYDKVITADRPSNLKIGFGVGMLVAGILTVKYL